MVGPLRGRVDVVLENPEHVRPALDTWLGPVPVL